MTHTILKSKRRLNRVWPRAVIVVLVAAAAIYPGFGFTEEALAQPQKAEKTSKKDNSAPVAVKSSASKNQASAEKNSGNKTEATTLKSPNNTKAAAVKNSKDKNDMADAKKMIANALSNIKSKQDQKNKYHMPEPVQEPQDGVKMPLGFTSLDKLGQKRPGNMEKFEKQIKGDADYVRSGAKDNSRAALETSPTLSWPGLLEKKAGPANGPSPNPSAGFTVSAPLMEEKDNSLYIYRHTPEREDDAHWGMMWSHKF